MMVRRFGKRSDSPCDPSQVAVSFTILFSEKEK